MIHQVSNDRFDYEIIQNVAKNFDSFYLKEFQVFVLCFKIETFQVSKVPFLSHRIGNILNFRFPHQANISLDRP